MVFLLNYVGSILSAYLIGKVYSDVKVSAGALSGLLLPIFLIWLFICGGQYDVGTDYWSYYHLFNGDGLDMYREYGEYLFVWIISLCNSLGLYGQSLFYVFYAINFTFFYLILKRLDIKYMFLFVLLYITVTSLFNNQLNVLRQATAIYIGTYALILLLEEKKWQALLFIIPAMLVHRSAVILLMPFFVTGMVKRFPIKFLFILLGVSLCLSFVVRMELLNVIAPYLSDVYANYITGQEYEDKGFIVKLTKLVFIPLYLLALYRFKEMKLTEREVTLFKWGIVSFCMRLSVLNLSIVYRMFDYFLILSIFPLYYYLRHLFCRNRKFWFLTITFLLSLFYILKVTLFANSEYLYKSVYFP